jgi:hypothetical protein
VPNSLGSTLRIRAGKSRAKGVVLQAVRVLAHRGHRSPNLRLLHHGVVDAVDPQVWNSVNMVGT